jgi:protein tyrosine phosphatase (PTP) superfamily phosphohydrolase (DUF442 family)
MFLAHAPLQSSLIKWIAALAVTLLEITALASDQEPPSARPQSIEFAGLHNVFKIDDALYSGSSPDSDAAFAALARAGVKVIISVDGSKPHVELARRHGMRYVHLPIGYDGLPKQRIAELIKSADSAHGPIYIHCHHGKHRGPAAVAAVCEGIRGWHPDTATAWLKQAGTSDDYAGLYRDIHAFQKPDAETLAKIPSQLPEVAPTPSLVDAMVAMDEHFDRGKAPGPSSGMRFQVSPISVPRKLPRYSGNTSTKSRAIHRRRSVEPTTPQNWLPRIRRRRI